MVQLGRMPEVGDEVEVAGVTLHVVRIAGRRIELLRVRAVDEEDA